MNTKKLIGTSMIALLVIAMGAGMAAAATAQIYATDSNGDTRIPSEFGPGEDVYAKVTEHGLTSSATADIYVVFADNSAWTDGEPIDAAPHLKVFAPISVSTADIPVGTYILVKLGTVGTEIPYPDSFDLVYDEDKNGNLDVTLGTSDNDAVNHWDTCVAFSSIPEFATIAIPMVALLGLVLYMRRKKD